MSEGANQDGSEKGDGPRLIAGAEQPDSLAALRETDALFRALADSAPAPIWVTGANGIEFVNRALVEFSGRPPEGLFGTRWAEMIHPDDLPELMSRRDAAWAGHNIYDFTVRMRRADGAWRWLAASLKPRFDAEGNQLGFVGMATDVTDSRRVEAELRESEARFRAMADSAPSPVWVTNATGIEFVNKAFVEMTGKPQEALTGAVWTELIHPDELAAVLALRDRAWETGTDYGYDARYRDPKGDYLWMKVSCRARFDVEGRLIGYVGMAVDINDGKRAEAALRESQERLLIALAAGQLGDWVWDAETDMVTFSDQAASLFGIPPGPVMTWTKMQALIEPGDAARAAAEVEAAVAARTDYSVEYRLLRPGGTFTWVAARGRPLYHADGRPKAMIGVVQDINARKAAEERLRESEEQLRIALGAGQLGDWVWDVESDMISFSAQAAALFDAPEGPVISWTDMQKLIDPEDQPDAFAAVEQAVRDHKDYAIEYRMNRPDGGVIWLSAVGRPIYRADGSPKGVVGVVQDISARKANEAALHELNQSLEARVAAAIAEREQAEEALRQSQKMEAVGQLTGGIAHDFNNLLTVITGNVDAARRHLGEEAEPRIQRALGNALVGAERAATLTQRLLAFSRRQPLNPRPVDANKLVNSMSELLHRTLGETVAVETVLAAGLWRIEVDANQLENAILNLAVNARDAMPEGGKLTIETTNMHLDRDYAAQNAGASAGQYVAICVSDIGTGMDGDTLARAFEPFFTTKEVGKGTGLGLSMVYGFVKQSGGHLKIYSEEGQGTTVRIYLPRLIGGAADPEEDGEEVVPAGSNDETILVCEDDDDVRVYTVEVLRELGYRVLEAHDGPSALRLLERQEGKVDLLFTDVVLPGGMTGAVLAQEARALFPDLRILFTTGYARNAIVHHGRLDPGVELITKPFAYAELASRLRDMLDRS